MNGVHNYRCHLEWAGSTGDGYEGYDREHRVSCPPSGTVLELSSDTVFLGNPERLNPEQLLLVAASSCQLLSFLAVAARARINVRSYTDVAEAVMPDDDTPMRITRITLRPRIVVAGEVQEDRVRRYVDLAHRECFIANSLTSEMVIVPQIALRPT